MSNNLMLVGVATPDTSKFLSELCMEAPIQVLTAPILIMSAPGEYIPEKAQKYIEDKKNVLTVVPFSTPYVYNPRLHQTEALIACHSLTSSISVNMLRNQELGIVGLEHFTAYFVLAFDPARTSATLRFMNSICSALVGRTLNFQLSLANSDDLVYTNYNVLAQQQIAEAVHIPVQGIM